VPAGAPQDFRVRLALALKTTASDILDAAQDSYRGVFTSADEHVRETIAAQLPPHLQWILACADSEKLREGYENNAIVVWQIGLDDSRVMVFESLRHGLDGYQVPIKGRRVTVYARREV
jgi:hypothetical protein